MATAAQKQQIVQYLANAGFTGADLVTATAIVLRESGGNPAAFNGNTKTGDESYGLAQINMLGSMGTSRLKQFGLTSKQQLLDPQTNANAFFQMYKQGGFQPWLGYRPGLTVAPQMAQAQQLVQSFDPSAASTSIRTGLGQGVPLRTDVPNGALSSGGGSIEDTVRELYGYAAVYLDDPDIGPVLRQAAEEGWSAQRLQGALFKTNWWQTTQASARTWDNAEAQDPATARSNIEQRMADIRAQAAQTGFSIDPTHLYDLARDSLRLDWSTQQLNAAIGAESFRNGSLSTSSTMQAVRAAAAAYAVPMADSTLTDWGQRIASGQATTEDFRQTLVTYAKGLYPGLAKSLDQGLTVKDYADPYIQTAAQTLGVSPGSISLSDPKWSAALNGIDSKTGERRVLTLDEWNTKLKSEDRYGWQHTADARAQTSSLAATLGQRFGTYAS